MMRRFPWLLVALLALAAAVRMYRIQAQSVWFDEAFMIQAGQSPWPAVLWAEPNHPPLYALFLYLVIRLCGDSVFALRWASAMIGVVVVALAAWLAQRLFNRRAALFTAFLAAFSPNLWWASQEIRMYILMAAFVLIAAEGWHAVSHARPSSPRDWLKLWVAELLLLYTQRSSPVAVLWLNAATLVAWISRRSLQRPAWRTWLVGQAGVVLLWAPWVLFYFLSVKKGRDLLPAPPPVNLTLASAIWQAFWSASWEMIGHEPVLTGLSALLFAVALLVIPWRTAAGRWLVFHVIALATSVVAGLLLLQQSLHGRYLVLITPLLPVLIGGGLAAVARRPGGGRPLSILLCAPFLATFVAGVYFVGHNPAYAHDDARGMVEYYAERLSRDDTVVAWSYAERYDLLYYWERLNVQAKLLVMTDNPDLDTFWSRLPRTGNIAVNTWYQERGDYGGMMPCVLGHGTTNLPEGFGVSGMRNELYRSPALERPSLRPLEAPFEVAQVTAVGAFPEFTAAQALCLPVQITLTRHMDTDLKVALTVQNELGWEVARADGFFIQTDQHTSARLGSGDSLTAFPLLRLPYGAPAGEYTLILRIYDDDGSPSGYDLLSPGGAPAGKDLRLGAWRVRPGADWAQVNRSTDLPIPVHQPVSAHLTLVAQSADPASIATVTNGGRVPLSLLWQGTDPLPPLTLAADDGRWRIEIPARAPDAHDAVTLDWRELRVPAETEAGNATLSLPNGAVLARYTIRSLPFLAVAPDVSVTVEQALPGVGELVGFSLENKVFDRSQPVPVTLVWRAGETTPGTSYTVFVQLLSADGQVMAQSDALPAQGQRPTTTWRPGEYVVDAHPLIFHPEAAPGEGTLIAGMYDASTQQRLLFQTGTDAIILATGVQVK
ncbi:MAG: PMT 2 protein [Anaerolineales bacterium]|nr:PMT 2 protein [Anaerolineales bacterium]